MPDDLNATILFPFAIPVMEFEAVRSKGITQVGTFDLSVVITCDENYVTVFSETRDYREEFVGCGFIVNKIAQQNQSRGVIIAHQLAQPDLDRFHSPKRDEPPGRALA